MLENDKEIKKSKVDTPVSNTEPVEKSIFDLLDIEEQENEQAFLSHTIISKVDGYRMKLDDDERIIGFQVQNKMIDDETSELVDFTFTLNAEVGVIKESEVKQLIGKTIKAINIVRYTDINKNSMGQEISRQHRYGGKYADMVVVAYSSVKSHEVNTYVELEISSVANVLKKGNPTGDVKLISIKTENNGSIKTFNCKLKHNDIGRKLEKSMFKPILGKTIRINHITDSRINGETYYSTSTMPVQT